MESPRISKFFFFFLFVVIAELLFFFSLLLIISLPLCCVSYCQRVYVSVYEIVWSFIKYFIMSIEHCINVFFKEKEIFFFFSSSFLAVALVNENVSSSTAHIKLQYGIYTNEENKKQQKNDKLVYFWAFWILKKINSWMRDLIRFDWVEKKKKILRDHSLTFLSHFSSHSLLCHLSVPKATTFNATNQTFCVIIRSWLIIIIEGIVLVSTTTMWKIKEMKRKQNEY